ncbi:type I restriction enzyme HsdR N-terminal domain-containing protein [Pseudorhodobacter sp.]|uniref:type I restriction enzyme HsdR N-terminal domain-containing protein n=1 Tax=Pseudorhodobacter sp. TaxID=1934400 RepID=UPI002648C513|nr:type I restriction enzyme HsdR N-terminal domain-containing protein [Pseudorhodobacter sp.]MDN5787695.1 type I restriction enzyme HsdR N-terminal domain-containing protein [Pseudorhodobacter sp.]
MDFIERVKDLSKRSKHATKLALTEEATKTSVVLPLIQTLGFDVFNLEEVVPEFIADVGLKKGEKVDFALNIDGKLSVLIEVKPISMSLGSAQFSQLYRYFAVTSARLAILTNGKEIWFFSDVDEPNKMDKKPFFTFDLQSHDEGQVQEFSRFQKDTFSIDTILEAASNLKYTSAAASYIKKQLVDPDEEFTKLVGRQIYDGMLTKAVVEMLKPAIQSALDDVIRNRIQDKLNVAFRPESSPQESVGLRTVEVADPPSDIITTEEEVQAFMIVRAICAKSVAIDRITMRDAKTYCSVFLDDNNRKPICRFYFNAKNSNSIGIFDGQKAETKHLIQTLSDIYQFASDIEAAATAHG